MKVLFVSLGCDKNLVDTECMLGILRSRGYEFTDDEYEADIICINSCCFINDAKKESVDTILDMAEMKKEGRCKALIVTGCLAHRYQQEILEEITEVDAYIGTTSYDKIVEIIESVLAGKAESVVDDADRLVTTEAERVITTTGGFYEYLKIAEGCDKHCTYCVIPKVRGNFRSYPMEYLINQAKYMVDRGVKEIILVAQETTVYGTDIYGRKALGELLHELCKIEELRWVRILYCYPEEIDESLIMAIKNEPKVCKYLDMPIQHGSDNILKRMGRRTNQQQIKDIVARLREEIPDIVLRTTLITGFPGETEEDFEELMSFVNELEFDRLGVFTYSPEDGTPAAIMDNQIPEEVKAARRDEVMELQQEIAEDIGARRVEQFKGRTLSCIIEGQMPEEGTYVARSYMDAPNVDGYVFIETDNNLMSGDFVEVSIESCVGYDLIGRLCE